MPHRVVLNGIYELPFGRDRRWGADTNAHRQRHHRQLERVGVVELAERARQLSDYNGLGNVYYNGDINQLTTDFSGDVSQSRVRHHRLLLQRRGGADQRLRSIRRSSAPTRASSSRTTCARCRRGRRSSAGRRYTNVDMSFVKAHRLRARPRADALRALQRAERRLLQQPANLDPRSTEFGKVTSQNNLPRNFQIGMKVLF